MLKEISDLLTTGEVAGQAEVGEAVEQVEGEEQVGGHPVAVRLDMHRNARVMRESSPIATRSSGR